MHTRSAAHMGNIQWIARLHSVNCFMFRAMIAKDPLDIRHSPDEIEVANQQHKTNHAFYNEIEPTIPYLIVQQTCDKQWCQEKHQYGKTQREQKSNSQRKTTNTRGLLRLLAQTGIGLNKIMSVIQRAIILHVWSCPLLFLFHRGINCSR